MLICPRIITVSLVYVLDLMKYIVSVRSYVEVDAETTEEATDQVDDVLEDARKRNCGDIEDEILAGATITKIELVGIDGFEPSTPTL